MILHWMTLFAGVLGLVVGTFLIIDSRIVKNISSFLNKQFLFMEKIARFLDSSPGSLDDWIMIRPKAVGAILLLISIFLIINGLPAISMR